MAKNLHLEHLEDEILNKGTQGAMESIKMLEDLGKFLSEDANSDLKITTKFDGAPAIICGIDPSDRRFFVGTKSVFAKTEPKVMKTREDIFKTYNGELAQKLVDALTYLPQCNIKGVLQGDLMFTGDKRSATINNKQHITFKPNTLTYAVESRSKLGRQISTAKLGIVFHTKYTGSTLSEMSASFDINDGDFKSSGPVWAQKAQFQNIGGAANFTPREKDDFNKAINMARGSLQQSRGIMNDIQTGKKALGIDTELRKFFNAQVKGGRIPNVESAYNKFFYHLGREYAKPISKMSTLKGQANKAGQFIDAVDYLQGNKQQVKMMIATYMNLMKAKMMVVNKLSQIGSMGQFVREANGDYRATTPEGFVAIGARGAIKLVDRLEFSRLNFTIPKTFGR